MFFEYWRWKRMARKAIAYGWTTQCALCDDPIVPGDFVGVGTDLKDNSSVLVHAGYHFTLNSRHAICKTGAIGSGIWSGKEVLYTSESLVAKALRTGKAQVM